MIRQLFAGLWWRGAVVVATSNRPPEDLYYKGLQRTEFLPFIAQLKDRCHVHSLAESGTDYRLLQVGCKTRLPASRNILTLCARQVGMQTTNRVPGSRKTLLCTRSSSRCAAAGGQKPLANGRAITWRYDGPSVADSFVGS